MDSSVAPKDEIWFLRVCHHISKAIYWVFRGSKAGVALITHPHYSRGLFKGEVKFALPLQRSRANNCWV